MVSQPNAHPNNLRDSIAVLLLEDPKAPSRDLIVTWSRVTCSLVEKLSDQLAIDPLKGAPILLWLI